MQRTSSARSSPEAPVYRSSPARKYGPLALIAAVQLVVVLVAPSTAPTAGPDTLGAGSFAPGTESVADPSLAGAEGAPPGTVLEDGSVVGADGSITTADGTVIPAEQAGGGGGPAAAPGAPGAPVETQTKAAAGDTSHCVGGRQFAPKIDYFAPPCVPGKPGATGVQNGGATSMGVHKDRIDVVHYIPDYGAEVNAILRAQGLYYGAREADVANKAFSTFLNANYNLSGRKIRIITYQGTCRTVPPDLPCLIGEMNRIAKTYKPFAVHFNTTVCSRCYAELARLKIVSFGGHGFSEEFRQQLKPYNYDDAMSSTRMALTFAQWWCGQMTSKGGTGRTAIYAGNQNAAQDFRDKPRQLGVVSTDDPDNKTVVKNVLYPALKKGCNDDVDGHEYFYEQNVSTAAQQSQAGTAVMNSPDNPATSVLCLCDPVAPQFSYNGATNNNYWPEVLFATNQSMDTDNTGQTYMQNLACPQPQRGCAFDGALGLGHGPMDVAPEQKSGVKVFKSASKAELPVTPLVMQLFWDAYNMFGSLVQATGPELTPARMAAAAPTLGSRGGGDTGFARRAFENGELSWTRDVRLLYWNKNKTSPYNGQKGSYVQAGGKRFDLGQFPKAQQPPVPTKDKRA
jgi:hypothetical protein